MRFAARRIPKGPETDLKLSAAHLKKKKKKGVSWLSAPLGAVWESAGKVLIFPRDKTRYYEVISCGKSRCDIVKVTIPRDSQTTDTC